jgi:predicted outer membrane protein
MSRQLWIRGIWGIAVSVATSAVAIAAPPPQQGGNPLQQPQQPQQQFQNQTFDRAGTNRPMAGHNLDHFLVKVLIKANKDEIEMGKLAEQRSSNADIKQLATQMVQDHTRFLNQLEQFKGAGGQQMQGRAAFRGTTPDSQTGQPQQQQTPLSQQQVQQQLQHLQNPQNAQQPGNINQPAIAGQQGIAGQQRIAGQQGMRGEHMMGEHGPAGQFAMIMEEVDRNMQQSLTRELSSKQGAEFDRCYLTGQLFGHMWVVEALKTFQQHASPQLRPILQEGLQTSEQHLTHIKSVLARSENEPRTGRRLQRRGGQFNR